MKLVSKRNKNSAIKKMKSYLVGRDGRDFKPTQKKARYWFNIINAAAFDGRIAFSNILVKQMKLYLGLCTEYEFLDGSKTMEIKIDEAIKTRKLFIETICHELIHLLQFQKKYTLSHRSIFFIKWKRYFKNHFDISI